MLPQYSHQTDLSEDIDAENLVKIASELSFLDPTEQGDFFVPNLGQKMYTPQKIFVLPQYSIPQKKKAIFKQSAAPTLATLAGAANGLAVGGAWACWD